MSVSTGREVAYRLFAAEYDDASLEYAESDEERAPNYVITPTGARVNRLFVVGTLTEVTSVNEEMLRARVVDPTGAFVVYAGQYQPDELAFLERAEPPAFVAVTGKARTFEPDDSDQVYTSVRPESIATLDADTRDRWAVDTAEETIDRIETYAAAADVDVRGDALTEALLESGVSEGLATGIPLAQDHYGTTPFYLERLSALARDAVRVVAGERDEAAPFDHRPDQVGDGATSFDALAGDLALESEVEPTTAATTGDLAPESDGAEFGSDPDADSGSPAAGEDATDAEAPTDAGELGDVEERGDAGEIEDAEETVDAGETATEVTEPTGMDGPAEMDEPAETTAGGASDETSPAESGAAIDEAEANIDGSETATDESGAATDEPETATDGSETTEDEPTDELGDFQSEGLSDEMYEMDEAEREEIEEEFGTEFTTGSEVEEPGEADIDVPDPDAGTDDASDESANEGEPDAEGTADEMDVDDEADQGEAGEDVTDDEVEDVETADDETADDETADDETEPSADEVGTADAVRSDEEAEAEPSDDVDLESSVVETMRELDEGDGADRSEVVSTVAAAAGASAEDVEAAIEDALMGGQCYEPDDETLKAI